MKFLGRLLLWQKLALLVAALLVPAVLLAGFYLKTANDTVRQANLELAGAKYTRALDEVLLEMIRHRGVASVYLNGDKSKHDAVLASEAAVQKAIDDLNAIDAKLSADLQSSTDWSALRNEWSALK